MKKLLQLIILTGWVMLVMYLSFQNGQDTTQTSHSFTRTILRMVINKEPDWQMIVMWDGWFRMAAHFVLFLLYGIFSTRMGWIWRGRLKEAAALSGISGMILAVVSEVGKLFIAGRHCDGGEICLNVIGAAAGTVLTVLAIWMRRKRAKDD